MTFDEAGLIYFDNKQWLPLPEEGSNVPLLSSERVVTKEIEFTMSCSLCPDFRKIFVMTYGPGNPALLKVLDPMESTVMRVKNGDIVTPIKVAVFDNWNNRCGPDFGNCWMINVEQSGPLTGPVLQFAVQGSGEALISGLKAEYAELTSTGALVTQTFLLNCPEIGDHEVSAELKLCILPTASPSSLEVHQH